MKTTIGVLLVFLVFLSLSCQKDSGVESAGNNSQVKADQKGKTITGNNSITDYVPCDEPDAMYYQVKLEIWTHATINNPSELLREFSHTGNVYSMHNPYISNPFSLAGGDGTRYDVKVYFNWYNCLPYCPTDYWSSAAGRVAHYGIYFANGGCIFGTLLSKPSGSATDDGDLVTGGDSFVYSPLVNNVHQLAPDYLYEVRMWWVGEDPL
jgi:hypothetical protein